MIVDVSYVDPSETFDLFEITLTCIQGSHIIQQGDGELESLEIGSIDVGEFLVGLIVRYGQEDGFRLCV